MSFVALAVGDSVREVMEKYGRVRVAEDSTPPPFPQSRRLGEDVLRELEYRGYKVVAEPVG